MIWLTLGVVWETAQQGQQQGQSPGGSGQSLGEVLGQGSHGACGVGCQGPLSKGRKIPQLVQKTQIRLPHSIPSPKELRDSYRSISERDCVKTRFLLSNNLGKPWVG